jgi:hypothetical protein
MELYKVIHYGSMSCKLLWLTLYFMKFKIFHLTFFFVRPLIATPVFYYDEETGLGQQTHCIQILSQQKWADRYFGPLPSGLPKC